MNTKRKNELDKYWLKINKMQKEIKYMKYDAELKLDTEFNEILINLEKIDTKLKVLMSINTNTKSCYSLGEK
tara:strand:- start:367 stop:582 length:216 start_codon:yes stop_codon:yes gene_type:complete